MRFKPTENTKFYSLRIDKAEFSYDQNPKNCIKCLTKMIKSDSFKSNFIGRCQVCKSVIYFMKPMLHQMLIASISNKIINVLGSVNTLKTTASAFMVSLQMRQHTKLNVLAIAQTEAQLDKTAKESLSLFFYEDEFKIKNEREWVLYNGSKISWVATQRSDSLRGPNVNIAWFMEASGIKYSIYSEGLRRLRGAPLVQYKVDSNGKLTSKWNRKEKRYELEILSDKTRMIIESNVPDDKDNWVVQLAYQSHTVIYTPNVQGIKQLKKEIKPKFDPLDRSKTLDAVTVLLSTVDMPTVSSKFISTLRSAFRSKEEYEKALYCNITYQEGLLYTKYFESITKRSYEPWQVADRRPDGNRFKWIEGIDGGGARKVNDETGYLLAIVDYNDPAFLDIESGVYQPVVYIVDGYKKNGNLTRDEAKMINDIRKKNLFNYENQEFFVGDRYGNKTEKNTGSNFYKDLELYDIFIDAVQYDRGVLSGVGKVLALMKTGALKFCFSETHPLYAAFKSEFSTYAIIPDNKRSINLQTGRLSGNSVVDKNNHLLDTLRFIISGIGKEVKHNEMAPATNEFKGRNYFANPFEEEEDTNNKYLVFEDDIIVPK